MLKLKNLDTFEKAVEVAANKCRHRKRKRVMFVVVSSMTCALKWDIQACNIGGGLGFFNENGTQESIELGLSGSS